MNILILGGTGVMGIHIVNILNKKGHNTYITSRREIKSKTNTHYIKGNAHSIEFIKEILRRQYDAIIDFMSYKTTEFEERVDILLNNCFFK